MNAQRPPLELLFRPNGSEHWHSARGAAEFMAGLSTPSESHYSLVVEQMPGGSDLGRLEGQVLVLRHFISTTEVRYLPNTKVRYWLSEIVRNIMVEIVAQPGPLPQLPEGMEGHQTRHPTFLSYTARYNERDIVKTLLLQAEAEVVPPDM